MKRNAWVIVAAIVFAFVLRVIREWVTMDRTIIETFSRWEWGANFLLYWLLSSIAVAVVFLGVDVLWRRSKQDA